MYERGDPYDKFWLNLKPKVAPPPLRHWVNYILIRGSESGDRGEGAVSNESSEH